MKLIQCDRCGQDTKDLHIQFQGELLSPEYAKRVGRPRYGWDISKRLDLCGNCKSELMVLLENWFTEKE